MPDIQTAQQTKSPQDLPFLVGSGEMIERVRSFEWATTPLGALHTWPQSLRTAVCLTLHAKQPMFVAWGCDLTFLYNDEYSAVLGEKHPRALGRPFANVWSDIWPQFGPIVQRVIAGEALAFNDLPIPMMRNGYPEDTWFSFSYTPLHDEDGQIVGVFCACNETTDKVRGEDALRASESQLAVERARLDALFRLLPVGVNFTDATGRSLLSNPAFQAYVPEGTIASTTGREATRWTGFDAHGRHLTRNQFPSVRALRGEESAQCDFLYRPPSGPEKWTHVSAIPLRDATGQVTGALSTIIDIDPERRAQEALRRLNENLEQKVEEALAERNLWADIFATTDAFIMVLDFDYRILAINPASSNEFEEIYGVRLHVGDNLLECLADQPEQQVIMRALWAPAFSGSELTVVQQFGLPGRRQRHYEVKLSSLRDRKGEQIGAFHYALDVTARVLNQARLAEAEEQLRQSQKMEAVGQLTGGIAHDFNNLLTGISGSLEMMQRRLRQGRTADLERFITTATTAASRAAALTHRLLAFSRRQPLDPKPVDANRLVASMEELLRRTTGESVQLELVLAGGLWRTLCDPNQLENALLNLTINARDAMPSGGKLTIETCNADFDDASAASACDVNPGHYVCISVTDTGHGMPPDVISRAFDPFFTTKPLGQGTGLGLSMIYGFTRQSEGHAKIQSEVGKGTTVKLYLPRHRGEGGTTEGEEQELAEELRAESSGTVLVVEDEQAVRDLVVDILSDLGYGAIEAIDGPAGLDVLESSRPLDLLITDIGLPGLSGRQLADAARAARPDLKVLLMTGYAENAAFPNGFLESGMELVTKPFSIERA